MMFTPTEEKVQNPLHSRRLAEFYCGVYETQSPGALRTDDVQRDAYYHPTVDNSEEPFKWGLPDLDGLRE